MQGIEYSQSSTLEARLTPSSPRLWTKEFIEGLGDLKVDLTLKPDDKPPVLQSDYPFTIPYWIYWKRPAPAPAQLQPTFMKEGIPQPTREQRAWGQSFTRTWQDFQRGDNKTRKIEHGESSSSSQKGVFKVPALPPPPGLRGAALRDVLWSQQRVQAFSPSIQKFMKFKSEK